MREKLTPEICAGVRKPGYHADGGGLYLNVKPDGRKYWCFRWRDRHARYTTQKSKGVGRLREKGLGRFGEFDVSLEDARLLAAECRRQLRQGEDPIAQARKRARRAASDRSDELTFGYCVSRYIDEHKAHWRNEKHAAQWSSTLNNYAAPLMALPVADIDTSSVLTCLEPIWTSKTETATRVRQRIESVLAWAIERKFRSDRNPARWRGHLDRFLPNPTMLKKVKHRPALEHQRMGAFMSRLRSVDSLAASALELQILTAAHPGEVVAARWPEFGLNGKIWTVPAGRLKAREERAIPLSPPAIELLKRLPRSAEFVFPGASPDKGLSTAAVMKLIRKIRPGISAQGFRTTFRTWALDQEIYPLEVIDSVMSPQLKERAEATFLRSDLIAKRARLMRDWANFCG